MRNPVEFCREVLGLEPYEKQCEVLMAMANHQRVVLAIGRRGGKSTLTSAWSVYDSVLRDLREYSRPNEPRYVLLVAASLSQARSLFRTISDMFKVPDLAGMVLSETMDELRIKNIHGELVVLRVMPCSDRSTRGLPVSTLILEEIASYMDTSGHASGESVYRALAPSVAQYGADGRIIAVSSPRGQRGVFYKLYQRANATEGEYSLNCPSWELNPGLDRSFLEREKELDAELFSQEYEASFVAIGGSFFDSTKLAEATRPIPEHEHFLRILSIDPAFSGDDFGICIACIPKDDQALIYVEFVDALRKPGFAFAMDHVATLARDWNVQRVISDQMSSQAIYEELGRRGVKVDRIPWVGRSNSGRSKSHRYGSVKRLLNLGNLILPDDPQLRSEFMETTVKESATAPGYAVETHGTDDRLDATIMAVSELAHPKSSAPTVHDFGIHEVVIPEHQRHLGVFFGSKVPLHAIDRID